MIGLVALHLSAGCADIWGFQDLTGSADASISDMSDVDLGRVGGEAGSDNAGGQDGAQPAPDAGDAAPTACGSTDTVANCGGCGNVCDVVHSVDAGCTGSTCVYAGCAPGYADCDTKAPDTNGCETPISGTDCAVCGATGCDATHSIGAKCVSDAGIACTYGGCVAGYADCNTTPPDTDGCETSLLSASSCGSCRARCDTSTGTPSCDGTTCAYRCKAGRADCNAGTAPDTDGCECATPQCCAGRCETIHSNGIGENFYDCNSVGTHSATQAQEACAAAGAMGCVGSSKCCLLSALGACIGTTSSSVCGIVSNECHCWQYAGTAPGTVQTMSASNCSASCGAASDPPWN